MPVRFGFSCVGLLFLLLLFLPNLVWTKKQPQGYRPEGENRALRVLERAGQVLVTCAALLSRGPGVRAWSPWTLWLLASAALMALYECWWVRYFRSGRTLADFYGSFCGVPVPGAVLPAAAFFLLGVYGRNLFLIVSDVILGIGHIGIHLQHRRRERGRG